MNRLLIALTLAILLGHQSPFCFAGGCGHLYQRHVVKAAVVQPLVLYSVGDALLIEAAVEKAFQRREGNQPQPQPGSLQQTAPSVLTTKCVRCHQGTNASGGLDLRYAISDHHFRRTVEMLGEEIDVPERMAGVIKALTPAEKGQITSELMRLKPARPEPQTVVPPPEESGILR